MPYLTLSLTSEPPIALIALNRPAEGNRIDRLLLGELRAAFEELAADRRLRATVLTGAGEVFSLGWDTSLLQEIQEGGVDGRGEDLLGSTFQLVADAPFPVLAAINGDALSAGLELALACDLRLAASTARLGLPEVAAGVIPMGGGTQRLARLSGRAVALELILTADPVDAQTALRYGLVSVVTAPADTVDAARTMAEAIARRGPLAVRLAKEAVQRGVEMPLSQALRYETDLTVLLQTTLDRAEGVRAFAERRPPRFEGR